MSTRASGPPGPSCIALPTRRRTRATSCSRPPLRSSRSCAFPLGALDKAAVRAHAQRLGLPVADKPDSQDICFVPTGHYSSLVAKLRPEACEPGDIVHVDGRVMGRHGGTGRYTVGQRRGLAVADGERLYVVGIEPERRRVVVGPSAAAGCAELTLTGVNWLGGEVGDGCGQTPLQRARGARPDRAFAARPRTGRAWTSRSAAWLRARPASAIDGTRLLGGGWIEQAPLVREAGAARLTA